MNLNTDALTLNASVALLDATFIGTADYMGMEYFWHHKYRHSLRDASYALRRRVHRALLTAGLAVDGEGTGHADLIERLTSRARSRASWPSS